MQQLCIYVQLVKLQDPIYTTQNNFIDINQSVLKCVSNTL
jgi:hypothetical protein